MLQSLDIWISAADDWEQKGKQGYRGKDRNNYRGQDRTSYRGQDRNTYRGKKYNKGGDTNDDDYENKDRNSYGGKKYNKGGYKKDDDYENKDRKKRSYSRVRFPVRQFKDIRQFPLGNFHLSFCINRTFSTTYFNFSMDTNLL
jgi:hypothetical protein